MSFAFADQSKNKSAYSKASRLSKPPLVPPRNTVSKGSLTSLSDLQMICGHQAIDGFMMCNKEFDFAKIKVIQPKLKISHSNDVYEQEADKIAEQVMKTMYIHLIQLRQLRRQRMRRGLILNVLIARRGRRRRKKN